MVMRTIVFELCAESIQACLAAKDGGADRIELCSALSEGGVTPSTGLILEAIERTGLPIHVMLRPRGGDFVYSADEFHVMCRDLLHIRELGVSGFVLGLLNPDGTVDVTRTTQLVALADPFEVTFHRAFDQTADLTQALEDVIQTGCQRVLTSGGANTVNTGAQSLLSLVKQAGSRIEVAVGGGLRLQNAGELVRFTGSSHFHGSLRRLRVGSADEKRQALLEDPDLEEPAMTIVNSADVRAMIQELRLA